MSVGIQDQKDQIQRKILGNPNKILNEGTSQESQKDFRGDSDF